MFPQFFVKLDLTGFIGSLLVLAMIAFIIALVVFLRENFLAVNTAHRKAR